MTQQEEITRRRTFAVIAHPDAGKTTLTEKLLLFGGAIHVAGAVKSNKIKKGATSDFMEIERQRGISVATAVMGFEYRGCKINILDTPGHEDFAEDTYRTLTAVDSVIIVIDGAKGVEAQTRKLMEVCRMRQTPVIVFINKLDRPSKEPFDLLDEVEKELNIRVRPLAFPISNGPTFKGVYNLYEKNLSLFTSDEKLTADASTVEISDLASQELEAEERGVDDKIVTFLGRITYQKGPDYFVEAAAKVLKRVPNVRFVMAGSGDMMNHVIRRVARLGIADRFHFTGFLRGEDVHRMFQLSDVYVMPSVSEPFGISPLEAMRSNVPVIISKQSGVAEVLDYAVKVDYWDVDALADAIYGLIKYPALSGMFASKGLEEVTNLKWNDAAAKIKSVYEAVIEENKKQLK